MIGLSRRRFVQGAGVAGLGLLAGCGQLPGQVQAPAKAPHIGVLTLGARRPWMLRSRAKRYDHEAADRGAQFDLSPGSGDLLVMGGRAQADWEHSVPKVPGLRAGRVSVQWRWTSRRGRPEVGANYRAPRFYSR